MLRWLDFCSNGELNGAEHWLRIFAQKGPL